MPAHTSLHPINTYSKACREFPACFLKRFVVDSNSKSIYLECVLWYNNCRGILLGSHKQLVFMFWLTGIISQSSRPNSGKSLGDGFYQFRLTCLNWDSTAVTNTVYVIPNTEYTVTNTNVLAKKLHNNQILTSDVHLLLSENEERW